MNLVRKSICVRPSHGECQARRRFCDSAQKIKANHYQMKKLYGGLVRSKSKPDSSNVMQESKKKRATEMHWLLGKGNENKIHIFKGKSSTTTTTPTAENSVENDNDSGAKKSDFTNKAKDLLRKFSLLERHRSPIIPFDDAALKEIPKYSLVCPKANVTEIDDALQNQLPSISKILTATMPEASRFALQKWKLAKIRELGEDGFREYEQMTLRTGQLFHSSIQEFFEKQQLPDDESPVYKLWQSVGGVLSELDPKPVLIEKSIVHPHLKYKGIIDSVAVIKDTMCALEWKTSEKSKPRLSATFDAPIQLCAYLGALNIDPRYDITAEHGYVVVAYKDGTKANAFCLTKKDVQKYWSAWLQRVQEFWIRSRDGTLPEPI